MDPRRQCQDDQVVETYRGNYSPAMPAKLTTLLDRLKARQRDLILAAAETDALPAASVLRAISELENAIAAVEAVADEERDQRRLSR